MPAASPPPPAKLRRAGPRARASNLRVSGNWSAKLEYDYIELSRRAYDLSDFGLPPVNVDPNVHLVKLGLNYRLGDAPPWVPSASAKTALPESNDWNVHAQTTFLPTGYPAFRSPYAGPFSLPGSGQARETWTTTAFLGVRLWQGGEFYFDPELAQGFGLNGTLGLAGFSNGEAQKAGAPFPKYPTCSAITFGRHSDSAASRKMSPTPPINLPGKRDIDRVTLIVGRFAVGDFFDGNSYAKDPRADFMNWAMWSSAAYDFPADLPGYTRGAVVELNRKDWAVRAGLFEVPSAPNSDVLTFNTGGAAIEFEERHKIFDQPGKLRLGIFANRGNTGNYRQTLCDRSRRPSAGHQRCDGGHPSRQPQIRRLCSTPSSRSQRTLGCSPARAGTTARTKSCRSPISIAASRAAFRSRAVIGAGPTIPSASAARSMACPARTATSSQPAGSAC